MPSPTVSDRMIVANRSNALQSTGPKSPEGKARSSQNARRHNIFCKDLLVPGEDPIALEEFKLDMLRSLNPRTVLELQLVEQIIADEWRIKRVRAAEQAAYERRSVADPTVIQEDMDRRERLERTVRHVEQFYGPGKRPLTDLNQSEAVRYRTAKIVLARDSGHSIATPGAVLDRMMADGQEIDRLSKYEQRLRNSIFRAMKELRLLRNQTQEDPSDLTAGLIDAARVAREKNEATENASPESATPSAPDMPAANLVDRPARPVEPGNDAKVSDQQLETLPQKPVTKR